MKIILTIILVWISLTVNASEIIVRVQMFHKIYTDQTIDMYYMADNLDSISNRLQNMKSFKEREILEVWGKPLIPVEDSNCVYLKKVSLEKLISKNASNQNLTLGEYSIKLSFSKKEVEFCSFLLYANYWASYDTNFKKAYSIIKVIECLKFSMQEKKQIEMIGKI